MGAMRSGRSRTGVLQTGLRFMLGASMLAIAAGAAQAQDNAAEDEQERAPLLSAEEATVLEGITVTAVREARSVLDVPQNVTVITGETLDRKMVRDIQDLVRYQPGISVDRQTSITNPFGQLNAFNIRGMGANRVQMLVDGSRIQERSIDGSRDFVDPFNMKSVEIIRGPNSVLWGSDALGGVVAFRTLDPEDLLSRTDRPWAVEMKAAYDSFDNSFRKQVTGAAEAGDFQFLASIGHLSANEPDLSKARADGGIWGCTRPASFACDRLFPADTDAWNGLAKLVWTPSADHEIKLTGEIFDRKTHIEQVFDYAAGLSGFVNTSYPRDLDMQRARLALEHRWTVGAGFIEQINWQVSYSPQSRDTRSFQTRTYPSRIEERLAVRDYGETFLEGDVQITSVFDTGPASHTVIWGFDGDLTDSDYSGYNENYRSDTGVTTRLNNQGFNFPKVDTQRADFYIQDEIKLFDDRLTLTPGLRYSTYSIDPTGDTGYTGLPGFKPQKISQEKLITKFGAVWDVNDTWSLYASYGEGFKMPTSQQLFMSSNDPFSGTQIIPNPNLKPESVRSYEAGVRGQFANGYFSLGGFYADYTNFIRSLIAVDPAVPGVVTSDNVEDVQLWGIEFAGEYEFHSNWWLTGAVSYQHGNQRLVAGAPETAFDGAVPLTATVGLRHFMPQWNLEAEVIGTFGSGVTRRADPNAFKPDGYAVFDAFLSWRPNSNFELNAGILNIFDTRYFPNTLAGYANTPDPFVDQVNPLELQTAPGRTFKLGATMRF